MKREIANHYLIFTHVFLVYLTIILCGTDVLSIHVVDVDSFDLSLQKYLGICGNSSINRVQERYTVISMMNGTIGREWTLLSDSMNNFLDKNKNQALPYCRSFLEIVQSSDTPITPEKTKSCRIKWLSHEEICNIFSRYKSIEFIGDSMTRHMTQGLGMILSGDYEHGAYSPYLLQLQQDEIDNCRCDGQFSGNVLCRIRQISQIVQSSNEFRNFTRCNESSMPSFKIKTVGKLIHRPIKYARIAYQVLGFFGYKAATTLM